MRSFIPLIAAVLFAVFCNAVAAQSEETISDPLQAEKSEVSRVITLIKSDTRSPTFENISGPWKPSPKIAGPGDVFRVTEKNGKIEGAGVFSGCVMDYSYTISGSRKGNTVTLKFESSGLFKESREKNFVLIRNGDSVLLAESGREKYPMVPYSSSIKK